MQKYRHNFLDKHIARMCGHDGSTVVIGRNFRTITVLLAAMFRHDDFPFNYIIGCVGDGGKFNTEKLMSNRLPCFAGRTKDTAIILDGTELPIHIPFNPSLQRATYSPYKGTNTVKLLIGINAAGRVVFVSKAYPGRISDRVQTEVSKVLVLLETGAMVMADKGFLIEDLCDQYNLKLVVPPFASSSRKFTNTELLKTRDIAAQRIHVERAIRRAKENRILSDRLQIQYLPLISDISFNCLMLVNLSTPIVRTA